jgi:hypothetical protein
MDDHLYVFQATPVFDFGANATIKQITAAPYSYFQVWPTLSPSHLRIGALT